MNHYSHDPKHLDLGFFNSLDWNILAFVFGRMR